MKRLLILLGIHGKRHLQAQAVYLARYEGVEQ